jgi:hypothetical protein
VRACFRYISIPVSWITKRPGSLPIGSGEIESGHRYMFQKRLKIAGIWWKTENIKKTIALRVVQANRGCDDYWSKLRQETA